MRPIRSMFINFISLPFRRCADGYMGPRCEYKNLDGTYLRKCQSSLLFLFYSSLQFGLIYWRPIFVPIYFSDETEQDVGDCEHIQWCTGGLCDSDSAAGLCRGDAASKPKVVRTGGGPEWDGHRRQHSDRAGHSGRLHGGTIVRHAFEFGNERECGTVAAQVAELLHEWTPTAKAIPMSDATIRTAPPSNDTNE